MSADDDEHYAANLEERVDEIRHYGGWWTRFMDSGGSMVLGHFDEEPAMEWMDEACLPDFEDDLIEIVAWASVRPADPEPGVPLP